MADKTIVVDPPPQIIKKADTRVTARYLTQADSRALVDVQPKKMDPQVRLPENITMSPDQVGRLPLTLPPAATESHVFPALQNASLILAGQIFDDNCQAI